MAAVAATWLVGVVQAKSDDAAASAASARNPGDSRPPGPDGFSVTDIAPADSVAHPDFPDFSGTTSTGGKLSLGDMKGKVVLINFWATWCGPCKMEIPDLIELQKKYGARGFTVVGFSEDEEFSRAAAFAKAAGMNYPVLKTPDGLASSLGITGLPTSILVGKDGKIVTAMSGVDPGTSMAGLWSPQIEKVL